MNKPLPPDIRTAYEKTDGLAVDDAQRRVVNALHALQQRLVAAETDRSRFLARLRRRRAWPPVRGMYLWGGVGRGKTFLMDLFFATLNVKRKRRIHFHRLMNDVHARLAAIGDVEDPLDRIADSLAREVRVLCFDEFFVSDIGDAMLLGRLLDSLFIRGVTLVATSNIEPRNLYRDGLQRERFLTAIRLLETHTDVVELEGGTDYRLRLLAQSGTLLSASEADAERRLADYFCRIAPGEWEAGRVLDVLGRQIPTVRSAKGVVWFEFDQLCEGPRSQQDYVDIARCYQTVIVSNVPVLTREREDATRRFIALVDEFYDRRVKLILSAYAGVEDLYCGSRLINEFERTRSRLIEMQSRDYLHTAHLA